MTSYIVWKEWKCETNILEGSCGGNKNQKCQDLSNLDPPQEGSGRTFKCILSARENWFNFGVKLSKRGMSQIVQRREQCGWMDGWGGEIKKEFWNFDIENGFKNLSVCQNSKESVYFPRRVVDILCCCSFCKISPILVYCDPILLLPPVNRNWTRLVEITCQQLWIISWKLRLAFMDFLCY